MYVNIYMYMYICIILILMKVKFNNWVFPLGDFVLKVDLARGELLIE